MMISGLVARPANPAAQESRHQVRPTEEGLHGAANAAKSRNGPTRRLPPYEATSRTGAIPLTAGGPDLPGSWGRQPLFLDFLGPRRISTMWQREVDSTLRAMSRSLPRHDTPQEKLGWKRRKKVLQENARLTTTKKNCSLRCTVQTTRRRWTNPQDPRPRPLGPPGPSLSRLPTPVSLNHHRSELAGIDRGWSGRPKLRLTRRVNWAVTVNTAGGV